MTADNGEHKLPSLSAQVRRSVTSIAALLTLPVLIGLTIMLIYSGRYQAMIRRMDQAAELKPALENTLAENLFAVAAGRGAFADSGIETLIRDTDSTLDLLLDETEGSGHLQLTIARRTMDTLERYALRVRDGMISGQPIDEIETIVDEVRNVGRLVADMLDAFITEEIANATENNRRLWTAVIIAAVTEVGLLLTALPLALAEEAPAEPAPAAEPEPAPEVPAAEPKAEKDGPDDKSVVFYPTETVSTDAADAA